LVAKQLGVTLYISTLGVVKYPKFENNDPKCRIMPIISHFGLFDTENDHKNTVRTKPDNISSK
jgi:hypothetical protein